MPRIFWTAYLESWLTGFVNGDLGTADVHVDFYDLFHEMG